MSDRVRQLMMARVDRELSGAEQAELDAAIAASPELREELRRYERLKEVTTAMAPAEPPREAWDGYWENVYRRVERGAGWVLVSVGAIVAGTWGAWRLAREVLADASLPLLVRWAILALLAGGVVLFVSVARERWLARRTDPYKDVVR